MVLVRLTPTAPTPLPYVSRVVTASLDPVGLMPTAQPELPTVPNGGTASPTLVRLTRQAKLVRLSQPGHPMSVLVR